MSEIAKKVDRNQDNNNQEKFEYLDTGLFYLMELSEKEWKEYWKPSAKKTNNVEY
jgi:hypothetical protein